MTGSDFWKDLREDLQDAELRAEYERAAAEIAEFDQRTNESQEITPCTAPPPGPRSD